MNSAESCIMTENDAYFFDSYALIEIDKGGENYRRYTTAKVITTKLNLFEVFYVLLREQWLKVAKPILEKYAGCTVEFDQEVIENAAILKFIHRSKNVSMVDCLGYVLARKHGVKFLTGDGAFEHMDNVEFVK